MSDLGKVLVIGSNSFSGASFCAYALDRGAQVIGVSRSDEASHVFLPYRWKDSGDFTFNRCDINTQLDELVELVKREKVTRIVNFAAQSMVGQSWEIPEHWFQTNAVSTTKLFNALKNFDFLERYVHITTPEVYGSNDEFITEDEPYNPSTPYAVSRAAGDMSLASYAKAFGFPAVMTRAANVFGPGQQLYRIIPKMILSIRTGQKLALHGGGVSRRSFIHIDDVSDATWKIMEDGKVGDVYHISTNEIVSIRELVIKICDLMGVVFEDHVNIEEERLGKDQAYLLSSEKIRNELGWLDKISLDDGLLQSIKWVDDNLDLLSRMPSTYIHKP